MARLKHKLWRKHQGFRPNYTTHLTDYFFIDRKIRGCETQLNNIENKLLKLKCRTGIFKILCIGKVERLTRNYRDYERLLRKFEAIKLQKMQRAVIYQDAAQDIKESFHAVKDQLYQKPVAESAASEVSATLK